MVDAYRYRKSSDEPSRQGRRGRAAPREPEHHNPTREDRYVRHRLNELLHEHRARGQHPRRGHADPCRVCGATQEIRAVHRDGARQRNNKECRAGARDRHRQRHQEWQTRRVHRRKRRCVRNDAVAKRIKRLWAAGPRHLGAPRLRLEQSTRKPQVCLAHVAVRVGPPNGCRAEDHSGREHGDREARRAARRRDRGGGPRAPGLARGSSGNDRSAGRDVGGQCGQRQPHESVDAVTADGEADELELIPAGAPQQPSGGEQNHRHNDGHTPNGLATHRNAASLAMTASTPSAGAGPRPSRSPGVSGTRRVSSGVGAKRSYKTGLPGASITRTGRRGKTPWFALPRNRYDHSSTSTSSSKAYA